MSPSRNPHAHKSLQLFTLGRAALEDETGRTVAGQRKRIALLALLAAAQERGVSRDRLMAMLSPESPTEAARHALHQLLYYLRQQVGDDVFVGTDPLRLNHELIAFDAVEFERAIERGELEEAASIYRGPFLDGFHLADSLPFDEWASGERTRLAERYIDVLGRLARAADARGDHTAAVQWWRALTRADPLNARATLGVMRALAAGGDRGGAVQRGREYQALLRTELDAAPDADVSALLSSLLAPHASSPEVTSTPDTIHAGHAAAAGETVALDAGHLASSHATHTVADDVAPTASPATFTVPSIPSTGRGTRVRWLALAAGLLLVVMAWRAGIVPLVASATPPAASASIAIAPLRNEAADSLAYLAEGVEDALVARLAAIPELRVVLPNAVRPHLALVGDLRALGRAAGAATVLTWRIAGDDGSLALHVALASSSDGRQLLVARYALEPMHLVALDTSLADTLLSTLGVPAPPPGGGRPTDGEAFALVMRARHYLERRDSQGLVRARDLFLQAIDRDPAYADAYAGLGSTYGAFGHYGLAPAPATFDLSRAASRRALELDPRNGAAIANLAHEQGVRFGRWREAEAGLRRAVALQPWRPSAWLLLGTQMRTEGRFAEARDAYRRARDLEPLTRIYLLQIARAFMCEGELDSALVVLRDLVSLSGTYPAAHGMMGDALAMRGDHDAALAEWTIMMREFADSSGLAMIRGLRGPAGVGEFRTRQARRNLRHLATEDTGFVRLTERAEVFAALGEVDSAMYWLGRARADRDPNVAFVGCRWEYDVLRPDPRFQALIREMGLSTATFGHRPLVLPSGSTLLARRP